LGVGEKSGLYFIKIVVNIEIFEDRNNFAGLSLWESLKMVASHLDSSTSWVQTIPNASKTFLKQSIFIC